MNYLLDTHVLLWWLADSPISIQAKNAISNPQNIIFVSSVTTWEIVIKKSLGKLQAPDNLEETIKACSFLPLPITIGHSIAISNLPQVHDDPFDRMLVAQAISEKLAIITRDNIIPDYQIPIIKA